ncbi:cytidine deaminase [Paraglaciecola hydrolytica]|uniref:Cytidine deaminase n=1 Tax=Paraglaciecola hydrolytica TaxID=1799789 RepID=A0A136A0F9_9ALTE|nr:cytidine deaminase [Paraglaciecola hydrolytica]
MQTMLSAQHQQLLAKAQQAQTHAHAPYSQFKVGAAIIDDNSQTHFGCNVENAAYPLGQCAEATAIGMMVVNGGKRIREILIASPNDEFCSPCGGCRQKIAEFADKNTLVHMATQQGEIKTVVFSDLLPLAFGFNKD